MNLPSVAKSRVYALPIVKLDAQAFGLSSQVVPVLPMVVSDERHLCALTDEDHSFIAVYVPTYEHFTVDISSFNLDSFEIYWYDPRFGIYNFLSSDNSESQFLNIAPPNSGDDYVLLLKRK